MIVFSKKPNLVRQKGEVCGSGWNYSVHGWNYSVVGITQEWLELPLAIIVHANHGNV